MANIFVTFPQNFFLMTIINIVLFYDRFSHKKNSLLRIINRFIFYMEFFFLLMTY